MAFAPDKAAPNRNAGVVKLMTQTPMKTGSPRVGPRGRLEAVVPPPRKSAQSGDRGEVYGNRRDLTPQFSVLRGNVPATSPARPGPNAGELHLSAVSMAPSLFQRTAPPRREISAAVMRGLLAWTKASDSARQTSTCWTTPVKRLGGRHAKAVNGQPAEALRSAPRSFGRPRPWPPCCPRKFASESSTGSKA